MDIALVPFNNTRFETTRNNIDNWEINLDRTRDSNILSRHNLAPNRFIKDRRDEALGYSSRNWHGDTAAIIAMRRKTWSSLVAFGYLGEET